MGQCLVQSLQTAGPPATTAEGPSVLQSIHWLEGRSIDRRGAHPVQGLDGTPVATSTTPFLVARLPFLAGHLNTTLTRLLTPPFQLRWDLVVPQVVE